MDAEIRVMQKIRNMILERFPEAGVRLQPLIVAALDRDFHISPEVITCKPMGPLAPCGDL